MVILWGMIGSEALVMELSWPSPWSCVMLLVILLEGWASLVCALSLRTSSREYIDLLTTFQIKETYWTLTILYILVEVDTSYNVLICQKTLNQLSVVVSTPHIAMKFPESDGSIIIVKVDPKIEK